MGKSKKNGKIIITSSPQETEKLGFEMAKRINHDKKVPKIFALIGKLGSGKTTFVKGFAKYFGIKKITSPSFTIINKYKQNLYHIDFFRLNSIDEVIQTGVSEIFDEQNSIVLVEWADKFKEFLPDKRWEIYFEIKGKNKREIKILMK